MVTARCCRMILGVLVILPLVAGILGCASKLELSPTLDNPPQIIRVSKVLGVRYDPSLQNYTYIHHQMRTWVLPVGPASESLLNKTFESLFETVAFMPDEKLSPSRPAAVAAVIKPSIEQFSLDFPRYPMFFGTYTAEIVYRFSLSSPAGVPIASWAIRGTGIRKAELNLSTDASISEVTDAAMQDAAYAFIKDFQARPEVQDWLKHARIPPPAPEKDVVSQMTATATEQTPALKGPSDWHDFRSERPLQVQFAVGGNGGFQRGAGLGYHFDERFYAGIIHWFREAGYGPSRPYYNFYGQEGVTSNYSMSGQKDLIELRYSPFSFVRPFYVSAGYFIDKGNEEHIVYDVRPRTIGSNVYVTGLDVTIQDSPVSSLAFGAGINYVWQKGWSVSAGFLLGLKRNQTDVSVSTTDPSVAPGDIAAFKQAIEDKHRSISIGYLAVGYNF